MQSNSDGPLSDVSSDSRCNVLLVLPTQVVQWWLISLTAQLQKS